MTMHCVPQKVTVSVTGTAGWDFSMKCFCEKQILW